MNKFLKKLPFVIYLLIMTLVLLEIGIRFWGYSEHYIYDPIYMTFDKIEDISYIHKPNLVNARGRGFAIVNTDNLGLRSKKTGVQYGPKKNNEYRIAVVGDSVTFGEGVERTEDTFVQVLGDTLNQKQSAVSVQVFNYGTSAYSVKEMLATLQYRVPDVEPDLVLMAIILEDFNLLRTATVDKWGYTVNDSLSGFVSKDSIIKRMLRKVRLVYLLRDLCYHWFKRSQNVQDSALKNKLPMSYNYVKQFREIAEEYNLPYIIVLLPSLDVQFGTLPEQFGRDEISFIDLSSLRNEFTQDQFRASKFDGHPSAMVHRRIGEALAEHIL